jgi:hypothetical protein
MQPERTRSLWWTLLPIFVGILGGIISYFILRFDDQRLAKFCLHLGIVLTIIQIAIYIPIFLFAGQIGPDFGVNI